MTFLDSFYGFLATTLFAGVQFSASSNQLSSSLPSLIPPAIPIFLNLFLKKYLTVLGIWSCVLPEVPRALTQKGYLIQN